MSGRALCCSARLQLALVGFLGCVVMYACRSNLSFSLVCMVNSTALVDEDTSVVRHSQCAVLNRTAAAKAQLDGEFVWSKKTQGALLSAFFWGYTSSQIAGGALATIVGGRLVVGAATLVAAVVTLLSPFAARTNVATFVALRALLGLSQGVVFPAMQQMWSVWAPPLERSLLTGISFAGAQIGNVVVMPLSGVLCGLSGWPSIFYVLGVGALLWVALWFGVVADSPNKHRRIGEDERDYINDSLREESKADNEKRRAVPWGSVLSSTAVWACFVGHFAGDWGAYTMATSLPLYMNDVMGYDLTSLGFISAVPYLAYFAVINIAGFLADRIRVAGYLSTLNTRRWAMLIAFGSQSLFLLLIGTANCGQEMLVVLYLTLGIGLSGAQYAGVTVNYLDIAPAFVGPIFGLGNTISCIAGIFAPLVMGWLTPNGSRAEWQMVFMVTSGVLIAGALFFCVFASGNVEEWARPDGKQRTKEEPLLEESEQSEKSKRAEEL